MIDPYAVLEIGEPSSATQKDIKAAYRKLCAKNHPDVNPGNPEAEERFKAVQAAYELVETEEKRARFDRAESAERLGVSSAFASQPNTPLQMVVSIPLDKTLASFDVELSYTRHRYCLACDGSGGHSAPQQCPDCRGTGVCVVQSLQGVFAVRNSSPCQKCRQRGVIYSTACTACQGFGVVEENRVLPVVVPVGSVGTTLMFSGAGGWENPRQPAAPLVLHVRTAPHEVFAVNGFDLGTAVDVDPVQAMLGGNLQVPTLDGGEVTLTMPQGTPHGFQHVFADRGIPKQGGGRGSLVVQVRLTPPASLTEAQKTALRQYLAEPHSLKAQT